VWSALAVGVAVVVFPGAAEAFTTDAELWSTTYCQELDRWRSEIAKVAPAVQEAVALANRGKVAQGQKAIAVIYRDAAEDSASFVDAMSAVDQPDVANGEEIANLVYSTFGGAADAFAKGAKDISKVKAKTVAALRKRGIKIERALQTKLDEFADSFGQLAELDTSGALAAQLTTLPVCAEYFGPD
jgi:hypothetical protein